MRRRYRWRELAGVVSTFQGDPDSSRGQFQCDPRGKRQTKGHGRARPKFRGVLGFHSRSNVN